MLQADEDAVAFANRVKKSIAKRGGLVDLEWDGQLKRSRVSPKMVAEQQKLYWKRIARTRSECNADAADAAEVQRILLSTNEEVCELLLWTMTSSLAHLSGAKFSSIR